MKETKENLKKLYSLYNDKNLSFYNPNKNNKKKEYKILLKNRKLFENKSSSLLIGNLYSNHLYFSGKLCRIEKYNPKNVIKKEILKINSLDKTNPIFKFLNSKQSKSCIKKKNELYKVRKRIFDSQDSNYEKKNNTLLNILEKNNYNYQKFPKMKIKHKLFKNELTIKKYKNEETNIFSSMTERKIIYDIPIIKKII